MRSFRRAGMRPFLVRVVASGVAIWVAALLVPGVELGDATGTGGILTVLLVALLFGVVNAFVKPVVKRFSLPLYLLTFGLFSLVVNALLLWLTAWLAAQLDLAFTVSGFWAALLGGVVVSVVIVVVEAVLPD